MKTAMTIFLLLAATALPGQHPPLLLPRHCAVVMETGDLDFDMRQALRCFDTEVEELQQHIEQLEDNQNHQQNDYLHQRSPALDSMKLDHLDSDLNELEHKVKEIETRLDNLKNELENPKDGLIWEFGADDITIASLVKWARRTQPTYRNKEWKEAKPIQIDPVTGEEITPARKP